MAALAGGIAFHAAGAVFMGLNGFVLSFLAAYPAVWWLARSCVNTASHGASHLRSQQRAPAEGTGAGIQI